MSQKSWARMKKALYAGLAVTLMSASPVVFAPSAQAEPSWCRPWAFVGIPGSGQGVYHNPDDPWGPQISSIRANFVLQRGTENVMKFPVDYPAALNLNNPLDTGYPASKAAGVARTKEIMEYVSAACPDAKFVLAGYSQGAHVASEVINSAGWPPRAKVFRVALIGNPRYSGFSNVSVPVGGTRIYTGPGVLGPYPWDNYALTKVKDVCIEDDLACDFGSRSSGTHGAYNWRLFPGAGDITITKWLGKYWLGNA